MLHEEGLTAAQSIYDEFPDAYSYEVNQAWQEKYLAGDNKNWRSFANVSDMLEAATNGVLSLGFGHGKRY